MTNVGSSTFSEFYEKWVHQLEQYLHQLLAASATTTSMTDQELQDLISKLTAHHKEYYTVKWAAARNDALAFFSPVWLTELELAYSWFTGWKPSMVFRSLDFLRKTQPRLAEMTEMQLRRVEEIRVKIRLEEEKVEREMERQQMGIADRKMVGLARLTSRGDEGGEGLVEVAVKGMVAGLEKWMKAADCVRLKALKGILDILTPLQCVEFLAGASTVVVRLRRLGQRVIV